MNEKDLAEAHKALEAVAKLHSVQLDAGAWHAYHRAIAHLSLHDFNKALNEALKLTKHFPRPADVLEQVNREPEYWKAALDNIKPDTAIGQRSVALMKRIAKMHGTRESPRHGREPSNAREGTQVESIGWKPAIEEALDADDGSIDNWSAILVNLASGQNRDLPNPPTYHCPRCKDRKEIVVQRQYGAYLKRCECRS